MNEGNLIQGKQTLVHHCCDNIASCGARANSHHNVNKQAWPSIMKSFTADLVSKRAVTVTVLRSIIL